MGDGWMCGAASSYLVNDAIPCKSGVVDDDVNLAVAELGGFLDQIVDIVAVEDIADDGKGTAGFRRVNGVGDSVGLFWLVVRYKEKNQSEIVSYWSRYPQPRPWRLRLRITVLLRHRCPGRRP